ncbi:Fc.00g050800.m01.CDS01 [Cosmosporella sp. VM-42]
MASFTQEIKALREENAKPREDLQAERGERQRMTTTLEQQDERAREVVQWTVE